MTLFKVLVSLLLVGVILSFTGCERTAVSEIKEQEIESSGIFDEEQSLQEEKITYLEKVGEISEGFCDEKLNYFARITSICVDREDNLYVADSGHHRIFKFDSDGKFITSFGRQGQGPGEFLGRLRISVGNDGKLYVTDDGNWRLSIFSINGDLNKIFPISKTVYDKADVNSKGEIYFLSPSGLKIIEIFDSSMKFKQYLLEMHYCQYFPYFRPPKSMLIRMANQPSMHEVKKLLTKDDHLYIVLNNSLLTIHLDKSHKLVKKFKMNHPRFVKDYKKRLNEATKKGAWINCFGEIFFDDNENLCFCYYNASLNLAEIFRYKKNGTFLDTLRTNVIGEKTNSLISTCDSNGNFYSICKDFAEIRVFCLKT